MKMEKIRDFANNLKRERIPLLFSVIQLKFERKFLYELTRTGLHSQFVCCGQYTEPYNLLNCQWFRVACSRLLSIFDNIFFVVVVVCRSFVPFFLLLVRPLADIDILNKIFLWYSG